MNSFCLDSFHNIFLHKQASTTLHSLCYDYFLLAKFSILWGNSFWKIYYDDVMIFAQIGFLFELTWVFSALVWLVPFWMLSKWWIFMRNHDKFHILSGVLWCKDMKYSFQVPWYWVFENHNHIYYRSFQIDVLQFRWITQWSRWFILTSSRLFHIKLNIPTCSEHIQYASLILLKKLVRHEIKMKTQWMLMIAAKLFSFHSEK